MARKIKVWVTTGFANAKHEDEMDLPEGWDDMTDEEQEAFLEEAATGFRDMRVDCGAEVVGEG